MKKLYRIGIWAIVLTSALLTACQDEKPENEDKPEEGLAVNHWIEKVMRDDYLWNTEIPEASKLNYSAEPEQFFHSLLSLKDGKTRDDKHHYYSYIEKNREYTGTRTSIDRDDTYGIEFTLFNITGANGSLLGFYWTRILYVLPNSPAQQAGLKRGDWIVGFDGKKNNIISTNFTNLLKGGGVGLTVATDPRDSATFTEVALTASRTVEDNPLYASNVIEVGGRKIGYLLYNHFTTGPGDYTDRTYDKEMEAKFKDFASQGVNEFVLDLRYNGGGYLSSATVLAALLVPEKDINEIFCINTDNKGQQSKLYFNREETTTHLNLSRLFVLTSNITASASEAVINGLTPFMEVILIGQTTEGKNVGSVHYAKDEYEWALQPIIIRITSKDTSVDYSKGFPPNVVCNELDERQNKTDELLPFGDRNEFMLSKAIELITGNRSEMRAAPSQPSPSYRKLIYNSTARHQTNGVLLPPNYTRDTYWNH